MNYYQHHIGDYDSHTAHLSLVEDAIYRRLICLYYRAEKPLPSDVSATARLIRATPEADLVGAILDEFFALEEDGWHHRRCDEEIAKMQAKAERNRANGQKSPGRPPKETRLEPTNNPDETQDKPTGLSVGLDTRARPLANSHYPIKEVRGAGAPSRKSKIDLLTWELDEEGRAIILAEKLEPASLMATIRDWAANAPPAKRLKADPHAFLRNWCRTEAKRWRPPNGLDRANGDIAERAYLGKTNIPVTQAMAHAAILNGSGKVVPPSISETEVRELVAAGYVTAERAKERGFSP